MEGGRPHPQGVVLPCLTESPGYVLPPSPSPWLEPTCPSSQPDSPRVELLLSNSFSQMLFSAGSFGVSPETPGTQELASDGGAGDSNDTFPISLEYLLSIKFPHKS